MTEPSTVSQPGAIVALYVLPTTDPNYVQLAYRMKHTGYSNIQTVTLAEAARIFPRLLNVGNADAHPGWQPTEHK